MRVREDTHLKLRSDAHESNDKKLTICALHLANGLEKQLADNIYKIDAISYPESVTNYFLACMLEQFPENRSIPPGRVRPSGASG